MNRPPVNVAVVLALASVLLVGCSSSGAASTAPNTSASVSPFPTLSPSPTPTPTPEPVTATCENTVTAEAIAAFTAAGWTAGQIEDPWYIVEDFPAGVSCVWGDYTIATDNISWLAWAPVPDAQAETVINTLLAQGGWIRENTEAGVYVTAADAANLPMTDAEGYATTYLFADGQVRAATTKSELPAIAAPPGFAP